MCSAAYGQSFCTTQIDASAFSSSLADSPPTICGLQIVSGIARVGTPLVVPSQNFISLGKIASMEKDHKAVDSAKRGTMPL